MRADNHHSARSRIVEAVAVLFYLITSLPLLALFAAEAGWARLFRNETDSN